VTVKLGEGFIAPAESCHYYCMELFGDFSQVDEENGNNYVTSATWRYNGLKISAIVSVLKKLFVVDDNGGSVDGKTVAVGSGGWLEACVWIKEKAAELEKAGYKITSCNADGINGDSVNELIEYYLTGLPAGTKAPENTKAPEDSQTASPTSKPTRSRASNRSPSFGVMFGTVVLAILVGQL
jgi:hypothetical protein